MHRTLARLASPLLLALCAACASGPRPIAAPGTGIVPNSAPMAGRWVGTYTCAQGQTGLTLTLASGLMGQLEGRFEFYAVPGNPSVPTGAYRVLGWQAADGQVALVGVEWTRQPENYIMVGLSGRLTDAGRRFVGMVPECNAPFSLERR